nr:sulfated surface glycoprotein 185-like [Lolium perenne]
MPAQDDHDDHDEEYIEALAYHNKEAKDDSDDYVACIFQEWQLAMAEGREFEYPDNMTDDEIARLGVLISEVDRPVQPPLPRYATGIMPPGLSEEEALRLGLQDSATPPVQPSPPPPPYNPWGPPPPAWVPPPSPQVWAPPPPPEPGLLHLQYCRCTWRMFRRFPTGRGWYRSSS